ncbi:hypothetical protein COLO4_08399 [Corchorus olitorius]|uniref:G-patch domain-containing protein n=1 Tax=Corchorus olitorius TaxID=93759 RepID=A0A1R3KFZ5_9ROSI|nr:hypothetical protein COLO4_08399 [Corchorus olitorius]
MIVAQTSTTPYVEAAERSYECSFWAFEIDHFKKPKEGSVMAIQVMKKCGWKEGQGLGKKAQGMIEIIQDLAINPGFGLGFKPTAEDYQIVANAKKMRRAKRLGIPFGKEVRMEIPPLSQTFKSAGWYNEEKSQQVQEEEVVSQKIAGLTINVVTEEATGPYPWVYPMAPTEELDNWEAYDRAVLMSDLEI